MNKCMNAYEIDIDKDKNESIVFDINKVYTALVYKRINE